MAAQALSLIDARPRPGGDIRHFCEADTTTSMPHSSWRISEQKRQRKESTDSREGGGATREEREGRGGSAQGELARGNDRREEDEGAGNAGRTGGRSTGSRGWVTRGEE